MSFCWSTKLVRGEFPCSCSVQSKPSCKNHHHSGMALPFYPVMGVGMACPATDDSDYIDPSEESRHARRSSDMPCPNRRRCHHAMEQPPIPRPARTGPPASPSPPRETNHYQPRQIMYYSSYSESRSWTRRASPDFFYDDSSVSSSDSSQEIAPPSPIQRESYAPPERPPVLASYRQKDREAARLPPAGHHAPKKPSPQVHHARGQHESPAPERRGLLPTCSQRPQRPRSPVEPTARRRRDSGIHSRENIPRHPRQHERGLSFDDDDTLPGGSQSRPMQPERPGSRPPRAGHHSRSRPGDALPNGQIRHFYYQMPLVEAPFKTCACSACQVDPYS